MYFHQLFHFCPECSLSWPGELKLAWGGRWSCFGVKGDSLYFVPVKYIHMHGPTQENRRCVGPVCCLPPEKLCFNYGMCRHSSPFPLLDFCFFLPSKLQWVVKGCHRFVLFAARTGDYMMWKGIGYCSDKIDVVTLECYVLSVPLTLWC